MVARRGLNRTLADLNGMFAIALWDRPARTLHLVRDRLGIKPLFYGERRRILLRLRAQELRCRRSSFRTRPSSVASFLRFGYVPAPHSIYRDVAKVRPGEVVSFDASGDVRRRSYWSLEETAKDGLRTRSPGRTRRPRRRCMNS